jgi:hypothetical protein
MATNTSHTSMRHHVTTSTTSSVRHHIAHNDDKRGSRCVSSPWYVFPFLFFIYYCTNVYLLYRLCVRPYHQHQPPRCVATSPSPTTPHHVTTRHHHHQSPRRVATNANDLNGHHVTTSTCPTTPNTCTILFLQNILFFRYLYTSTYILLVYHHITRLCTKLNFYCSFFILN